MKRAAVLALPLGFGAAAAEAANLVETAEQRGRFDTLIRALEAAGMAETLAGEGPFTVFAPTDEAFAALPEGRLEELLAGEPARLEALLGHHVVAGRSYPSDSFPPTVEPLAGGPLLVEFEAGSLMVRSAAVGGAGNGQGDAAAPEPDAPSAQPARVVIGDIEADNGVLHAIDAVLVPPELVPAEAAVAAEAPPATAEPSGPAATADQPAAEPPEGTPPPDEADGATVQRVEPEVTVTPAEPEVTIEQAEPDVTVERQGEPEVTLVRPAEEAEPADAEEQRAAAEPTAAVDEPAEQGAATTTAEPTVGVGPIEPEAERPEVTTAEPAEAMPQDEATAQRQRPEQVARAEPEGEAPEAGAGDVAVTSPAADLVSFEELMGRAVRSPQGEELGDVSDVIFSRSTGEIELVIVEVGGFLGLWRKPVAVPWREVSVDGADGTLTTDLSREDLEAASAFDYEALDTAAYQAYAGSRSPADG